MNIFILKNTYIYIYIVFLKYFYKNKKLKRSCRCSKQILNPIEYVSCKETAFTFLHVHRTRVESHSSTRGRARARAQDGAQSEPGRRNNASPPL